MSSDVITCTAAAASISRSGFFETDVTSMFMTASRPMAVRSGEDSSHRARSLAPAAAVRSTTATNGPGRREGGFAGMPEEAARGTSLADR